MVETPFGHRVLGRLANSDQNRLRFFFVSDRFERNTFFFQGPEAREAPTETAGDKFVWQKHCLFRETAKMT